MLNTVLLCLDRRYPKAYTNMYLHYNFLIAHNELRKHATGVLPIGLYMYNVYVTRTLWEQATVSS
jgi:hypothetical protein